MVGEVVSLVINKGNIEGVVLRSGEKLFCNAVVITCGTFLSGMIHVGDRKILAGRMGESSSIGITEYLNSMGFKTMRLKTGTPPRALRSSIDWKKTSVDFGDKADESIFGLSKEMDDKTKCRILRQEYSRWNSQTNNSNKDKRVRAKEMVNLIANLRKQYNC